MRILLCSTPRSRSSVMIDYLVKKHNVYNFSEKLIYARERTNTINDTFLINQTLEQFYEKCFASQISELFKHDKVVAKLWGTMLTFNKKDSQITYTNISKIIPFDKFDKIYCLPRNVYDVASSWFYFQIKTTDRATEFTEKDKPIIYKAVLDVLLLDKIKNYMDEKKYPYDFLSYDQVADYVAGYDYIRKPTNINYQTHILNYEKLIQCVDECLLELSYLDSKKFI